MHARAHLNAASLACRKSKLRKIEARLAANVPGTLGTRKLFGQQHHLQPTGFDSQEAWLREWQAGRSHQVFFVGSKDEAAGNPLCLLQRATEHVCPEDSRVGPAGLVWCDKHLVIRNDTFGYDSTLLTQRSSRYRAHLAAEDG